MEWGTPGWLVIAAIVVVAALAMHPSARAAERQLAREAAVDVPLRDGVAHDRT
jgi:hypothetical protein